MNLLADPLFNVETSEGRKKLDLCQILSRLGNNTIHTFWGLQRHQEDAFHIFLCYLSGAVLASEQIYDLVQNEEFWRQGIRNLTGQENDNAWTLVVDDLVKPAFMQPPITSPEDFKNSYKQGPDTPDALDLLPTAKNHDVKTSRAINAELEDWIYALVSLQTMSGFFGQGNYGIARMNGGFASRPCSSLRYDDSPGTRWYRDVKILLSIRTDLLNGPWEYKDSGSVLTWLHPWDRKSSLAVKSLDPFFIEIARAIRLTEKQGSIKVFTAISKTARINAKTFNGVLGDPWIPINKQDPKKGVSALTVSAVGLSPRLLRNLLFQDGFDLTPMQKPGPGQEDKPCRFYCSVLVRGQGTTDGFHEVEVPIPGRATSILFQPGSAQDSLADRSKIMLNDAATILSKVLRLALFALLEGGQEKLNFDKREVKSWINFALKAYSDLWNDNFFPFLWQSIDMSEIDALNEWRHSLNQIAWRVLQEAILRMPGRRGRRFRAITKAESMFNYKLRQEFPELKESAHA